MKLIAKNKILFLILLSIVLTGCVDNTSYTPTHQPTQTVEKPLVETVEKSDVDYDKILKFLKEEETNDEKVEDDNSDNANLSNDNYYINSKGNRVHSPAYAPSIPAGATAKCRDGTYSFSQSRRGTCSHHGGVATWY